MKRALEALVAWVQAIRRDSFPAGHYHSTIPSEEDVVAYYRSRATPPRDLPGIDLNERGQHDLLKEYIAFYRDLPFPIEPTPGHRYHYENSWFSYSDAIFLHCFLRRFQPRRIVEVGSGFSSAVILDTVDRFSPRRPEITFIDPSPDRLMSLLVEGDSERARFIGRKIQDVPPDVLLALGPGDLLFLDSSHVVKCGSDVQLLMLEILPRLRRGVFVHFHDIFYPFDYPPDWMAKGRYWNENYFLRAFLCHNSEWDIRFFNTYVHFVFGDLIREKMPLCARHEGGSLYLQRRSSD